MSLNLKNNIKSFKYDRKLEGSVIYISKWSSGGIDCILFMSHRLSPYSVSLSLTAMQKPHLFLGYLQCNLTWSSQLSPYLVLFVSTFSGTF